MEQSSNFILTRRNKYWYVMFKVPNSNKWTTKKSTGTKNKLEALSIIHEWSINGLPAESAKPRRNLQEHLQAESLINAIRTAPLSNDEAQRMVEILESRGLVRVEVKKQSPGDVDFFQFISEFWDYDKSLYVKDKLLHKKSITKKHCYDMQCRLKYWERFSGRMMTSITQVELKELAITLKEQNLSDASINKTMLTGTAPLRWAKKNAYMERNPAEGLIRINEENQERGILTDEEVEKLFSIGLWENEMARIGNLLACTTGLRLGECLGLKRKNIGERFIEVWNWTRKDGMKKPKNNKVRSVPIMPEIKDLLLKLLEKNPHEESEDNFIFYSSKKDLPCQEDTFINGLIAALESIGITNTTRMERFVDFNSWRQYFTVNLADYIDERKARMVTGHSSKKVFQKFADHERDKDLEDMSL